MIRRHLLLLLVVVALAASGCADGQRVSPGEAAGAVDKDVAPAAQDDASDSLPEATSSEALAGEAPADEATDDEAPAADGEAPDGEADMVSEAGAVETDDGAEPFVGPEPGAPAPPNRDIRDVDFENGFVHPVSFGEELTVTVMDGEFIDEPGYLWFWVFDVRYDDLDGDGDEEAVVQTGFNTGGTGQFGRLSVWDIVDDRVVERGWIGTGDRADGGLWHYEIRDGLLVTENFLTDQGACCPNMVTQQRLALASTGLVFVEHIEPLRWLRLDGFDRPELEFLPGTSAAVVAVSGASTSEEDDRELFFEAGAGQWLSLVSRRGPDVGVRVTGPDGSLIGQSADANLELVLPADGFYEVHFTPSSAAGETSVVDIAITGQAVVAERAFDADVRELIVETEPPVQLLAMTPRFDLSDGGILNGEIDAWMGTQTDWWVADVIEYPPLDRDVDELGLGGQFELLYDVTLESDDLVSLRWHWYEYVCCRAYPNHGHLGLVVDVAARRIVPVDEILDLDRLEEIHSAWIDAAGPDHALPVDYFDFSGEDGPVFSSLALTPTGVEFGTDRIGPFHGTTTVVPWSALGDLVQPGIAERARAGSTPIRLD